MNGQVIIDTGVLVALINRNDRYHAWAKRMLANIKPPMLTCEAVVSETCFLLRDFRKQDVLFQWLDKGALSIAFNLQEHAKTIRVLMGKYADVPMSYADACLLRMAECQSGSQILTLDSDFRIYRKNGHEPVALIIPEE